MNNVCSSRDSVKKINNKVTDLDIIFVRQIQGGSKVGLQL